MRSTAQIQTQSPAPAAPLRRGRWRVSLRYLPVTLLLGAVSLMMVLPLIWTVMSSLKTNREFFTSPWALPGAFRVSNFVDAWNIGELGKYVFNSILITSVSTVGITLLGSMAAFAFARLNFRGRDTIFSLFLIGLIIPVQGVLIPLFLLLKEMGLLDTYTGLILSYMAWELPLSIYVMRAFFLTLPRDLEDAARIDGCGLFGIYWRVLMPLAKPAIATVAVFSALGVWNELLLVQQFIREDTMWTLPFGLWNFTYQHLVRYDLTFAAVTMISLPMILLYALFQRWFIDGLTAGAVKG
jgi:raffinose/stachyose/melibiose transport system permease protein